MSNKLISQMGLPSSLANVFAARNILTAKAIFSPRTEPTLLSSSCSRVSHRPSTRRTPSRCRSSTWWRFWTSIATRSGPLSHALAKSPALPGERCVSDLDRRRFSVLLSASLVDASALLQALSLMEDHAVTGGYLPTRLLGLDRALRGGIPFGSLTELVGPSGIGKTQVLNLFWSLYCSFCFTLTMNCYI